MPIERVIMAPCEGRIPVDMILDEDSEEMTFATIYCGVKRKCPKSYSVIARSELRRYDRRECRIDKILYNYKKLELINIKNNTSICLKKHTMNSMVTAANMLNNECVNNIIQHDERYRVLKNIRIGKPKKKNRWQ